MGRTQPVAGRPITRQAALRLVLSLALLVLLIAVTTAQIYSVTLAKAATERADGLAAFFQARLVQFERDWELQSRAFKVRLEFSRLLEQRPPNLARLEAQMTVQGVNRSFQYLLIQDAQGRKMFSFGTDLDLASIPLDAREAAGWYLDAATGSLYRIFADKVWLGEGGTGRMAMFFRLDNGILKQLATPGIELAVLHRGAPAASSRGQDGIDAIVRATRRAFGDERREIPWGGEPADATQLRIDAPVKALFAPGEMILAGSLIPIVDGLILWFTLGTWLMRHARRIRRLGGAVEEFHGEHRITARMEEDLAQARGTQQDEIDAVATALRDMAARTVEREHAHVAAQNRLLESERRFRDVAESAGEFIWEIDAGLAFLYLSQRAGEVFGRPVDALIGTSVCDYLDPAQRDEHCARLEDATRHGQPFRQVELHLRRPDGECRWVAFSGRAILDEAGRHTGAYRGTAEDITRRKLDEERLLLADKVLANSDQGILITDAQANIVSVNPAFTAITGFVPEEAIGHNPRIFASGRHDAAFYATMWGALKRHGAWSGEVWDKRKNGDIYPKWLSINAVNDPASGEVSHYVAIFSDITERKENEARIEHLAYHDSLTGLPNRFALLARLAQSLADARRNGQQLALMFIDLDHFKTINDSLGHDVGDRLLVAVSRRIRVALRESDTVARLGGDEFVIVVPGIGAPEDAARVAEKVIEQVGAPLALAGHTLHTSPSIGIGLFPSDGTDAETLMKNADMAMYYAKQHGRNAYHFFAANMNATATERLLMETQLHAALDRGEMSLVYQPQIDLATGAVVGVEALLRWNHPERGQVSPATFIPVAEDTGLIVPLGAWVLEEACRQAMAWLEAGLPPLRIAVNLSARQFREHHLAQQVAETLARTGLPAERLELEITESVVMDNARHGIEILRALRDQGIHLAIDDFGTGYSSLAYLKRFPIGRVKIDRSFVMDLEHDANDVAIARGIVALAQSLGIAVTAEGIETPAQLAMLKSFACAEGQGYLFSRPLAAADLAAFLRPPRPAAPASGHAPQPLLH